MTKWIARSTLTLAALLLGAFPVAAFAQAPGKGASTLPGDWKGGLKTPMATLIVGFRFATAADGSLSGYILDAQNGTGTRARMSKVQFANGKLTFEQPVMHMKFEGTLSGSTLRGTWSNPDLGQVPIELTRTSLTVPVAVLAISARDMTRLRGTWMVESGDSKGVSLHFETTPDGKAVGFADLPAFSLAGIPVSEATFTDGRLFAKMGTIQSEYRAQVSSGQMQGEWKYPGGAFQLVMVQK